MRHMLLAVLVLVCGVAAGQNTKGVRLQADFRAEGRASVGGGVNFSRLWRLTLKGSVLCAAKGVVFIPEEMRVEAVRYTFGSRDSTVIFRTRLAQEARSCVLGPCCVVRGRSGAAHKALLVKRLPGGGNGNTYFAALIVAVMLASKALPDSGTLTSDGVKVSWSKTGEGFSVRTRHLTLKITQDKGGIRLSGSGERKGGLGREKVRVRGEMSVGGGAAVDKGVDFWWSLAEKAYRGNEIGAVLVAREAGVSLYVRRAVARMVAGLWKGCYPKASLKDYKRFFRLGKGAATVALLSAARHCGKDVFPWLCSLLKTEYARAASAALLALNPHQLRPEVLLERLKEAEGVVRRRLLYALRNWVLEAAADGPTTLPDGVWDTLTADPDIGKGLALLKVRNEGGRRVVEWRKARCVDAVKAARDSKKAVWVGAGAEELKKAALDGHGFSWYPSGLMRVEVPLHKGKTEMVVYVPQNYHRAIPTAVVLVLHGGGGNAEWEARLWGGLFGESDAVLAFPSGRVSYWWGEDRDTARAALHWLLTHINTDPSKLFICGFSNGGIGSWFFAQAEMWRWAAAFPMAGHCFYPKGYDYLLNLLHMAVRIYHGAADNYIPPNYDREAYKRLKNMGADVTLDMPQGVGHTCQWLPGRKPKQYADILKAIKSLRRRKVPLQFKIRFAGKPFTRLFWVEVVRGKKGALITAKSDPNQNRITIETEGGVRKLRLHLLPQIARFDKPLEVVANGKTVFKGKLRFDPKKWLKDYAAILDPIYASGCVVEFSLP